MEKGNKNESRILIKRKSNL